MVLKPTVLIAGATGRVGFKIADAIAKKGTMDVKALVRNGNNRDENKKRQLEELKSKGIALVEGDIRDLSSLLKACENVETIVSAVSGNEDIALIGQLNLIEAAELKGVKRMIPSDYTIDYRKLDLGENYFLDMRIKVAETLEKSNLDYTIILNGYFMEAIFSSFFEIFDFEAGTFSYWGDGEKLFDTTSMDDTAKYVAEVVTDPEMSNTVLQIAGDVLNLKELLSIYEKITGKTLVEKQLGSAEELKSWIDQTILNATSPFEYLSQQYLLEMVSGKGKLENIQNERYPQIKPISVSQYIKSLQQA